MVMDMVTFAASPVSFGSDCNDQDPQTYMGATEVIGDGIDQDCDNAELCYADEDGDGFGSESTVSSVDEDCNDAGESAFMTDCDDTDATSFPGAEDIEGDGIDQDCDGEDQSQDPQDTGDTGEDEDTGDSEDTGENPDTGDSGTGDNGSTVPGETNPPKEGGLTCSSGTNSPSGLFGSLLLFGVAFTRRLKNRLV